MATKRKNRFLISLTDEELEHVNNLVKISGYSRESYTRMLYKKVVPPPLMTDETYQVLKELRKIASDINYIARMLKHTGEFDSDKYEANYKLLQKQIFDLYKLWNRFGSLD